MSQYRWSRVGVEFAVDGPPPRFYERPKTYNERRRRIRLWRKTHSAKLVPALHADGTEVTTTDFLYSNTILTRRAIDEVCGFTSLSHGG